MKKIFTLLLLLVVAVTLTGCTIPFIKNKDNTGKNTNTSSNSTGISGKIKDILASGKSVKCEYSFKAPDKSGFNIKGTVYVSGKKSRSDLTMVTEGKEAISHYLTDAEWIYIWGDNMPGTKMKIADMQKTAEDLKAANPQNAEKQKQNQNMGIDESADLNCKNWTPDNSLLTPPTDVQFIDATETMKNLTETLKQTTGKVEDLKKNGCAVCNVAPDDKTKSECKAQLGCAN